MNSFVIGDVQGCYDQLIELIANIRQIDSTARLFFAGDLVNRGPRSLETLRFVKGLGAQAETVLGNHDLHLLAVAYGVRAAHTSDSLQAILDAPDREELLTWLRHRPLALEVHSHLLVHAGVYPDWSAAQTLALAQEVESELQGEHWLELLRNMYGNQPAAWREDLSGYQRWRCIINGLTRMRFCERDGAMDFGLKESGEQAPPHLLPWFELPQRRTQTTTVVCGHWSTLGLVLRDNLICLDTGCVWGGQLTALRLQDRRLIQVASPQHLKPF